MWHVALWRHTEGSAAYNFTKASCQAWLKLLIANEVRIGGPGGGGFKTDHFEAVPQLILVALAVDFEADVPGGNWVTVGFDSPLVRPSTCIGGRRSKHEKSNGRTRKDWLQMGADAWWWGKV